MLDQVTQLTATYLPIDEIFLDPNNPRFAEDGRAYVSDDDIDQEARQEELLSKLEREHAVDRLKDSIESNGYLPIDRIVVREFKTNQYVVLEGNRRIAAAKRLLQLHYSEENQKELNPDVLETLQSIPALIYTGEDPDAAWIFQGLRHISGIRDWSAYNKAKLLVEQMEAQGLSLTDAGKVFGISAAGAGQWMRGYYTYLQIKDHPDFYRDVDTKIFPYLQEVFSRGGISLRNWMHWNEEEKRFENDDHFGEFLSWLYPKTNENGEFDPDIPGNWDNRRISRAIDMRFVSGLIANYPDEFTDFRNGISLAVAQGRAAAKEEARTESTEDYERQLEDFILELRRLPIVQIVTEGHQNVFLEKIDRLATLLGSIRQILGNE